jgi:alkanesulfonate monooxygenase SsuD/methylene tetrahydromethanopterin reductase-like flavin-dependent oxidoreductase (luciferase family)
LPFTVRHPRRSKARQCCRPCRTLCIYGWFFNFSATDWYGEFSSAESPWTGDFYVEMAQQLERVCLDYLLIEDTLMVPDIHGGSFDAYLKAAMMAPKHDPVPLATLIAAATSKIGVVPTMSTTFYPPFLLARLAATCDHIARGRFGWNIVTSGEDSAAQNFGMEKLIEHDLRYDMADEYVELCCRLWDSWDPDAVVLEQDPPRFARGDRVRPIDFQGRFYKSRGPLNTVRPPSGRPTFVQAGGSPRGRQFAAKWADSIVAVGTGVNYVTYTTELSDVIRQASLEPKIVDLITGWLGESRWIQESVSLRRRVPGRSSGSRVELHPHRVAERLAVRPPSRRLAICGVHHSSRRHQSGERISARRPRQPPLGDSGAISERERCRRPGRSGVGRGLHQRAATIRDAARLREGHR